MLRPPPSIFPSVALPVLSMVVAAGCGEPSTAPPPGPRPAAVRPADHDHGHDHAAAGHEHAHPESLAEAVTELKELVEKVRTALAAGDKDKADGPVHAVGHLLEDMQGLVAKAKLPAEREAAVKQALEQIFGAFDTLDTAIHADGKEAVEFAPVEETITKALGVLGEGT